MDYQTNEKRYGVHGNYDTSSSKPLGGVRKAALVGLTAIALGALATGCIIIEPLGPPGPFGPGPGPHFGPHPGHFGPHHR